MPVYASAFKEARPPVAVIGAGAMGRVLALLSGVNRSLDTRIDLAPIILPYVMGARRD